MNRLERFYKIEQILNEQTVVSRGTFLDLLEISPATFKRDLEYMRDRFQAPVIWDRDAGGYRFETGKRRGRSMSCQDSGSMKKRRTRCLPCSICSPPSIRAD